MFSERAALLMFLLREMRRMKVFEVKSSMTAWKLGFWMDMFEISVPILLQDSLKSLTMVEMRSYFRMFLGSLSFS